MSDVLSDRVVHAISDLRDASAAVLDTRGWQTPDEKGGGEECVSIDALDRLQAALDEFVSVSTQLRIRERGDRAVDEFTA